MTINSQPEPELPCPEHVLGEPGEKRLRTERPGPVPSLHADSTFHPTAQAQTSLAFDPATLRTSHVPFQRRREAGIQAQLHFRESA